MGQPYFSCSFSHFSEDMCVWVWNRSGLEGETARVIVEGRKNERAQLRREACQCSQRDAGRVIQPYNTEFSATRQRCLATGSHPICLHGSFWLSHENTHIMWKTQHVYLTTCLWQIQRDGCFQALFVLNLSPSWCHPSTYHINVAFKIATIASFAFAVLLFCIVSGLARHFWRIIMSTLQLLQVPFLQWGFIIPFQLVVYIYIAKMLTQATHVNEWTCQCCRDTVPLFCEMNKSVNQSPFLCCLKK